MGRKPLTNVVEGDESVRFETVPARKMVVLPIDLTNLAGGLERSIAKFTAFGPELRGAIVKPVIDVSEDAIDEANAIMAEMLAGLRGVAHHVRRPDVRVVKSRRVRTEAITREMDPMDAARAYLEARPPNLFDAAEVLAALEPFVDGVPFGEAIPHPEPFIVGAVGVERFMPFKQRQAVTLGPGLWAVAGQYAGEVGASNRAGKSAFIEAILYALEGKTGRAVQNDKQYVHGGEGTGEVWCRLDGENQACMDVRRGVGTSALTANAVTTVSKAQPVIDKFVGMGYEDFVRTCFVRQGDLHGLLGEKSSAMQDALMRWLGVDAWAKVQKSVGEELRAVTGKVQRLTLRLEEAQTAIAHMGERPTDNEITEVSTRYEAALDVKNKADKLRELRRELEQAKRFVGYRKEANQRPALDRKKAKLEKREAELAKADRDARADIKTARAAFTMADEMAVNRDFDGECPIDGCACPRKNSINENVTALQAAVEKARRHVEETIKRHQPTFDEHEAVMQELDELQDKETVIIGAERFLRDNPDVRTPVQVQRAIDRLEVVDASGIEEIREEHQRLLSLQASYDRYTEVITECSAELEEVEREARLLRMVYLMCSRKGIPSFQMEGAVRELEVQANAVLQQVDLPVRVRFTFERELQKPADVCPSCGWEYPRSAKVKKCEQCGAVRGRAVADELGVAVIDAGREQAFDLDSGGGKGLVSLAVRVALARFLGTRVLFLDEVCGMLDYKNLGAFVRVVRRLLDVGFEQVFVISHRQEVVDAIERRVVVTRQDSESTIEVE